MFDMRLKRTPLFEDLRARIKEASRQDDVAVLLFWLLTHYNDDGTLRSPSFPPRRTIMLNDVTFWLVQKPKDTR